MDQNTETRSYGGVIAFNKLSFDQLERFSSILKGLKALEQEGVATCILFDSRESVKPVTLPIREVSAPAILIKAEPIEPAPAPIKVPAKAVAEPAKTVNPTKQEVQPAKGAAQPLMMSVRQKVLAKVSAGMTRAEQIAKAIGVTRSPVQRALNLLQEQGHVANTGHPPRLWYIVGTPVPVPEERETPRAYVHNDPRPKIMEYLTDMSSGTAREIATMYSLPHTVVCNNLAVMEKAGTVQRDGGKPAKWTLVKAHAAAPVVVQPTVVQEVPHGVSKHKVEDYLKGVCEWDREAHSNVLRGLHDRAASPTLLSTYCLESVTRINKVLAYMKQRGIVAQNVNGDFFLTSKSMITH